MSASFKIEKLAVLGPGLLGGSLCLAARKQGVAETVALWGRRETVLQEAREKGIAAQISGDLAEVVNDADFVILCVPIGIMGDLMEKFRPWLKPGAVVTDVGSVKSGVVIEGEHRLADSRAHFVGSHPMAGSEQSGLSAAREELFERALCILTPTPRSNAQAVTQVERFWRSLGCRTCEMSPTSHDEAVALVSHLPHAFAAVLVNFICSQPEDPVKYAGSGLRDTTRVASGPVEMWREILLTNRLPVAAATRGMIRCLEELAGVLETGDERGLQEILETAKQQRDDFIISRKHV